VKGYRDQHLKGWKQKTSRATGIGKARLTFRRIYFLGSQILEQTWGSPIQIGTGSENGTSAGYGDFARQPNPSGWVPLCLLYWNQFTSDRILNPMVSCVQNGRLWRSEPDWRQRRICGPSALSLDSGNSTLFLKRTVSRGFFVAALSRMGALAMSKRPARLEWKKSSARGSLFRLIPESSKRKFKIPTDPFHSRRSLCWQPGSRRDWL